MSKKNHIQFTLRQDEIEILQWKIQRENPSKSIKAFIREQIMFWQLQKLKCDRKLKESEKENPEKVSQEELDKRIETLFNSDQKEIERKKLENEIDKTKNERLSIQLQLIHLEKNREKMIESVYQIDKNELLKEDERLCQIRKSQDIKMKELTN